jgi:uroporphyrin-III C-methyltransferase
MELFDEDEEPFEPGTVAIVGAGPGSRHLLTLRALDRIQRADVILHDALVEEEVLRLALPATEVVDVGRRSRAMEPKAEPADAERIPLMIQHARAGKRVVRLHGGDPFVFGRGGEEVDALAEAGVVWEVVPGVSSVIASGASAGVPLTQRDVAKGFTVRTGHDTTGPTRGELPRDEETVVVLMGLGAARDVLAGLVAEGRSPDTPALAVSGASRPSERVVVGTLATLADGIREAELPAPATLIIGEVARRALNEQDRNRAAAKRGPRATVAAV